MKGICELYKNRRCHEIEQRVQPVKPMDKRNDYYLKREQKILIPGILKQYSSFYVPVSTFYEDETEHNIRPTKMVWPAIKY